MLSQRLRTQMRGLHMARASTRRRSHAFAVAPLVAVGGAAAAPLGAFVMRALRASLPWPLLGRCAAMAPDRCVLLWRGMACSQLRQFDGCWQACHGMGDGVCVRVLSLIHI